MGLRTKMKTRRRTRILEVAELMFRERGYSGTSLMEIADNAEVSIGTIYTYFGSKGGIIHELSRPLVGELEQRADKVIQNPPDNAMEAMVALFKALRLPKEWQVPNLVRAFDRAQTTEGDGYIEALVAEAKSLTTRKIRSLLDILRYRRSIREDLNLEDATFILENLMAAHLEYYVYAKEPIPFAQLELLMHRRVRLVFEPWQAPGISQPANSA